MEACISGSVLWREVGAEAARENRDEDEEPTQRRHRSLPGVLARAGVPARLGVPGSGFFGVGGGTSVSLRSEPAPCLPKTFALCTSFAARRAASPKSPSGRSASIRDNARNRSCGSVAAFVRELSIGRYDERAEEVREVRKLKGCEREVSVRLSNAKR